MTSFIKDDVEILILPSSKNSLAVFKRTSVPIDSVCIGIIRYMNRHGAIGWFYETDAAKKRLFAVEKDEAIADFQERFEELTRE